MLLCCRRRIILAVSCFLNLVFGLKGSDTVTLEVRQFLWKFNFYDVI